MGRRRVRTAAAADRGTPRTGGGVGDGRNPVGDESTEVASANAAGADPGGRDRSGAPYSTRPQWGEGGGIKFVVGAASLWRDGGGRLGGCSNPSLAQTNVTEEQPHSSGMGVEHGSVPPFDTVEGMSAIKCGFLIQTRGGQQGIRL